MINLQVNLIKSIKGENHQCQSLAESNLSKKAPKLQNFLIADSKKKWKKKITNNIEGLGERIKQKLQKKYQKENVISKQQELQLLKITMEHIKIKHQVSKIKMNQKINKICEQQKKWISGNVNSYLDEEIDNINQAVLRIVLAEVNKNYQNICIPQI